MEIRLKILIVLLVAVGHVRSQCTEAGWGVGEPKCPSNLEEIFRDKVGSQSRAVCCDPNHKDFKAYKASATECRVTQCSSGSTPNLCNSFATRYVQGKKLEYEEILREPCTRGDDSSSGGQNALCCLKNSMEGLLVTTMGAEHNEFPHQAKLKLPGHCGGTVYNKRYIVTAAHCIVGKETMTLNDVSKMKVILGSNIGDQADGKYVYGVKRAIPHPEYGRLKTSKEAKKYKRIIYDVAVLELDRDIQFGPNVKSLEIAPEGFEPLDYANKAVIAGWGTTDTLAVSKHLQKADFIIRRDDRCFSRSGPHASYAQMPEQLLCVGGILEGKWSPTAGGGDSGGPAVCRGADGKILLCGITSFGGDDEDCLNNQDEANCVPSVYAEVSYFNEWIKQHAGEQDPSTFYKPFLYGQPVPKGKYEHQVRITSMDGKPCGGTLIAPDVVVTAAQCVLTDKKQGRKGVKVTSMKGKTFTLKGVAALPGFKREGEPVNIAQQGNRIRITDNFFTNDMALLKLNGKVDIPPAKLAQLPNSDNVPPTAIEVSRSRNVTKADKLMTRDFKILDHADCQTRMNRMKIAMKGMDVTVDRDLLCGVEKYSGGSQCDRELGGGLICKGKNGEDILCGVQIFRLCEWSIPNGFINMALYRDWVKKAMKQL